MRGVISSEMKQQEMAVNEIANRGNLNACLWRMAILWWCVYNTTQTTIPQGSTHVVKFLMGKCLAPFWVKIQSTPVERRNTGKPGVLRKTKIGQKVKGIPSVWATYQKITDDDTEDQIAWKNMMNHILLDRHPYFFRYRYQEDNKAFTAYQKEKNSACQTKFGITIDELIHLDNRNAEQEKWVNDYYKYCPLIISDSPMNMLCQYMESFKTDIMKKVKENAFDWTIYEDKDVFVSEDERAAIIGCYQRHLRDVRGQVDSDLTEVECYMRDLDLLKQKMSFVNTNSRVVANVLLRYVYEEKQSASKKVVWDLCGKHFVQAARKNYPGQVMMPFESSDGEIEYMGVRYTMKEVDF